MFAGMRSRSPASLLPAFLFLLAMGAWASGLLSQWLPLPPQALRSLLMALSAMGLLILGLMVFLRQQQRRKLLLQASSLADLMRLDWVQFEQLTAEAYRRHGWRVEETGQGGADGGVDLMMRKGNQRCIVQVKQWQARVGAPIVREMFGLMVHHKVNRVAIVALGGFTSEAVDFARGKPIDLVDGKGLLALVGGSLPETITAPARAAKGSGSGKPRATGAPKCPVCQTGMVRRVRRQDASTFWGCPRYPGCTGTRNIRS